MTFWPKGLALAAAVAGMAAAADREMINLVMPDASMVMEINVSRILDSPIGATIKDSIQQGISTQLQGQMAKSHPELQERFAAFSQIDWSHDIQDILIAGGTNKSAPALIIVRTALDPAAIQALKGFTGNKVEYEGVPMLVSDKPDNGAIAFLGNSIVVAGQTATVQAAIHRRNQPAKLPPALAAQVAKYSQDDIWLAATGSFPVPTLPGAAASQPGAQAITQFFAKIVSVNGGLRFSPDFELSADVEGRTEKAAGELAEGLRFLTTAAQSQVRGAGQGKSGLEGFSSRVGGRHILLSLHVPEEQLRAGIAQMRAAQTVRPMARPGRRVAAAASQEPIVAPSSGLPPPPACTIRVTSSEGSVLIPTGNDH